MTNRLPWDDALRPLLPGLTTSDADALAERLEAALQRSANALALTLAKVLLVLRDDAESHGLAAQAAYACGQTNQARDLAAGVDHWRARLVLSTLSRDEGAFDEAIRQAEAAVALVPGRSEPAVALAELLRLRDRPAEAAAVLRRCLDIAPDRAVLWNHLGLAERGNDHAEATLEAFRAGARLDPLGQWSRTNLLFTLLREPGRTAPQTFALLRRRRPEIPLGLFCDRFPHTYGFLIQQFATYLRHFPDARAYSYGRRVFEPYDRDQFGQAMAVFRRDHPDEAARVFALVPRLSHPDAPALSTHVRLAVPGRQFRRPRLAHCIFAMNADLFRPLFEELRIPFTFTLNPGGGFRLGNRYSDACLRRVFASPMFRGVIVTYRLTRDYIRERFQVPEDRIELIHGTIVRERFLQAHRRPKRRYGIDKDSLDVCFVGLRYTPTGADKGYDRFIAAAHRLAARFPALRFHVVGNFAADTADVSAIADRITFHGVRDQAWLAAFYAGMDAVVSPNIADQISAGAFDGFPVTSCIEAGMCGVALFATDPMGLNERLEPGSDYVAITTDGAAIAATLGEWLEEPQRLYALAERGERRFHAVWGEEAQMTPRLALMERWIAREMG